jgi:D-3-phosphoglycerate dehydrogenase
MKIAIKLRLHPQLHLPNDGKDIMKPKIWLEVALHPDAQAQLGDHAEVVKSKNLADGVGAAAVILSALPPANGAFMDRIGPELKAIVRHGIGIDNVNLADATERGILVIHTPDGPTESTAEHAVALLLALAKRVVLGQANMHVDREQLRGNEVRNRTLGLIGFGRIGRRVAEICALGLKMKVMAYDPFIDASKVTAPGVTFVDALETVLSQADYVSVHVPLSAQTHHLLGEREFRLMKPDAFFINVSRGPIIDEKALLKVVQAGHLTGVGLDVFDPEPPDPANPLLHLPNVITTPHIAGVTDQSFIDIGRSVAEQVIQVLHGERPPFIANPAAWPGRVGSGAA